MKIIRRRAGWSSRTAVDLSSYGWPKPKRRRDRARLLARALVAGVALVGGLVASGTIRA